jgi:hypothetical protein
MSTVISRRGKIHLCPLPGDEGTACGKSSRDMKWLPIEEATMGGWCRVCWGGSTGARAIAKAAMDEALNADVGLAEAIVMVADAVERAVRAGLEGTSDA